MRFELSQGHYKLVEVMECSLASIDDAYLKKKK